MPSQSRSQRRRQNTRQPPQRQRAERNDNDTVTLVEVPMDSTQHAADEPTPLNEVPVGTALRAEAARISETRRPATSSSVAAPVSTNRVSTASRRRTARPAPEPLDYTREYRDVRRDLRWIAIWTVLLFAAMIALRFSGLV